MLLRGVALLRRVFGNGQIDEQDRILRRDHESAMEIIERAVEIAFGHERVAVIHEPARVLRTLDRGVAPKCFFCLPNFVALKRRVAAGTEHEQHKRRERSEEHTSELQSTY